MIEIIRGLTSECSLSAISDPGLEGQWVGILKSVLQAGGKASFALAGPARWMALVRNDPWWPRPVFGRGDLAPEGEFYMVLWEREAGGYGVALPLVDGDVRGILCGDKSGWSVRVPENDPLQETSVLLLVATGEDPLELVERAVEKIAGSSGTFKLRTQKTTPEWVDYLGWCTWDAFYLEVTSEKVLEGLASFKRGGFSPRVVILDAGWQDIKEEQLWSLGTNLERFPGGLQPLIEKAWADYGVKIFGVWHAFQGYWNGVHPEGELAGEYQLVVTEGPAYNMPDAPSKKRSLVHPGDAGRFYDDYHRILQAQGVSMVKVDNQGALDHFCTPEVPPTSTMRAYQYALQDSVQAHFHGESLHCMSNTTDAAYHLRSACVWRSSQDFFPNDPKTHGLHVFDNAFNSIWVRTFALPDWDMFQSGHPAGAFHAAARAISGGPVYVSDKPGSHDFGLLSKLMLRDGRILRSKQPAVPSRDTLFEDGRAFPRLTKIVNFNQVTGRALPIGVLGMFNCFYSENGTGSVKGDYCASDVPGIPAARFALYHHTTGLVALAERSEHLPIRLESLGYELVTVSPMEQGVALFGLLDKFNGSRALESACWISASELELVLVDGGRVGWTSERGTPLASFNRAPVEVCCKGDLAWVQLPEGKPVTLQLSF